MHEITILGTDGTTLARMWADRAIELRAGDTIDVDGDPASVLRVEGSTVYTMPAPPDGLMTDFLRYHVLFRVFDGDLSRWKKTIRGRSDRDRRFLGWLERRVSQEPGILGELRTMVETSGLLPDG
jgi:hypothetical protein